MNWTSLKLIEWTASHFEKKGIPNPRLDAELLLSHILECPRIQLYTDHEKVVGDKFLSRFRELVERRAKREPLQYILGETEFWGLKLKVTPAVLIPRPETEILVEEALKHVGARSPRPGGETPPLQIDILDIGTGSGCIAVALAKNLPEAKIIATDLSKDALAVAKENAEAHGVAGRIEFVLADVAPWRVFQAEGRKFDVIVSNPPYIATGEFASLQPEVRDFEPRKALDGGPDGLDIVRKILEEALPFLKPGGALLLEIGEGQAEALRAKASGVRKDYNGVDRILIFK